MCTHSAGKYFRVDPLKPFFNLTTRITMFLRLFVFFFMSSMQPVFADTVVLDFNNNTSTVDQIRHYSATVKETVLVFPNKDIKRIDENSLPEIIASLKDRAVSTLILSGHYVPASYSGKNGELRINELLKEIFNYKELSGSIKFLILRGCYTTRLNEVLKHSLWHKYLPNLAYISGYKGRAWSSETEASQQFIYDSLALRNAFLSTASESETINLFKQIRGYDKSDLALWFKTANNQFYLTTDGISRKKSLLNFNKITYTCKLNNVYRKKYNQLLMKYDLGEEQGFKRPSVDSEKGELRDIYEWLLKNQHCHQLNIWKRNDYDDVSKAAALLFFNRLTHNYQNIYNQYEFQQMLEQYNAYAGKQHVLPDLNKSSRQAIRKFTHTLSSQLYNIAGKQKNKMFNAHAMARLQYHLTAMNDLIVNLDTRKLPSSWLTVKDSFAVPFLVQ